MSADNFLGIYRANNCKYIGHSCWSECERKSCLNCENGIIFTAKSLKEAVKLAEEHCNNMDKIYEYGIRFLN